MNIIFLDIDGVLNYELYYSDPEFKKRIETEEYKRFFDDLCPKRVALLNALCSELDAKVVLCASARVMGLDYCREVFQYAGATFEIIDVTPNLRNKGYILRGNEILAWIQNNKELIGYDHTDFRTYVIIEDDSDMLYWQRDHLFLVDRYCGLTHNTCYRIKRFFTGIKNRDKDWND